MCGLTHHVDPGGKAPPLFILEALFLRSCEHVLKFLVLEDHEEYLSFDHIPNENKITVMPHHNIHLYCLVQASLHMT